MNLEQRIRKLENKVSNKRRLNEDIDSEQEDIEFEQQEAEKEVKYITALIDYIKKGLTKLNWVVISINWYTDYLYKIDIERSSVVSVSSNHRELKINGNNSSFLSITFDPGIEFSTTEDPRRDSKIILDKIKRLI